MAKPTQPPPHDDAPPSAPFTHYERLREHITEAVTDGHRRSVSDSDVMRPYWEGFVRYGLGYAWKVGLGIVGAIVLGVF